MAVLSAFGTAARGVGRNPILLVVAGVYGLLQVPQVLAQAVHPVLSSVVSLGMLPVTILVVPFVVAGLIAMAAEAIEGTTGTQTLLERGKRHYVSVLAAYLLLVAVNFVLLFLGLAVLVAGWVVLLGQGSPGTATLVVFGIVVAVLVVVYLGVAFFLQFFAHAIVLDDLGAVDGLTRSVDVVRTNLLATFGYSLVVSVLGGAIGVLAGLLSTIASLGIRSVTGGALGPGSGFDPGTTMDPGTGLPDLLPEVGIAGALVVLLLYLVVIGLFGGFFATYSTAFYLDIGEPT
jgi:hypothetical protein